jgi:hypothetical protein
MDHGVRQDAAWLSHCAPGKMTMPKFKFHKLAAIVVLIVFAGWVATGAFSSVGSDAPEENPKAAEKPKAAEPAPLRTVKVVVPPRQAHARAIRISGWPRGSAASFPNCPSSRATASRPAIWC